MSAPTVVVTLPARPEAALRCLEAVAVPPERPAHDVVLVDDVAPAPRGLLARVEGDVDVVRLPSARPGGRGACGDRERAAGDVVVLLDGGAVPAHGWLAPLVEALADPAVAAASRRAAPGRTAASPSAAPPSRARRRPARGRSRSRCGRRRGAPRRGRAVGPPRRASRARGTPSSSCRSSSPRSTPARSAWRCVRASTPTTDVAYEIVCPQRPPPQGFSAPVNAGCARRARRTSS